MPDLSKYQIGATRSPLGALVASSSGPTVLSAPLGGLPAMASQLQAAAAKMKRDDDEELASNRSSSPVTSLPPKTPPPMIVKKPGSDGETNPASSSSGNEESPPKGPGGLIKAKGTYYPLTAFPTSMPQGPVMRKEENPAVNSSPSKLDTSNSGKKYSLCLAFWQIYCISRKSMSKVEMSVIGEMGPEYVVDFSLF